MRTERATYVPILTYGNCLDSIQYFAPHLNKYVCNGIKVYTHIKKKSTIKIPSPATTIHVGKEEQYKLGQNTVTVRFVAYNQAQQSRPRNNNNKYFGKKKTDIIITLSSFGHLEIRPRPDL